MHCGVVKLQPGHCAVPVDPVHKFFETGNELVIINSEITRFLQPQRFVDIGALDINTACPAIGKRPVVLFARLGDVSVVLGHQKRSRGGFKDPVPPGDISYGNGRKKVLEFRHMDESFKIQYEPVSKRFSLGLSQRVS